MPEVNTRRAFLIGSATSTAHQAGHAIMLDVCFMSPKRFLSWYHTPASFLTGQGTLTRWGCDGPGS